MKYMRLLLSLFFCHIVIVLMFVCTKHFSESEKEFLFLSDIIYSQTKDIEENQEKLAVLTDWLHENIKHGKYPPTFDGSSVYDVIQGGVGNCGFQACNISVMANMMGIKKYRIFNFRKELGNPYQHAFAEIYVDNKWRIYDPDLIQYQKEDNNIIGFYEMIKDTTGITNPTMRKIFSAQRKALPVKHYKLTSSWLPVPNDFGEGAYTQYERYQGKTGFKFYLVYTNKGKEIIILTICLTLISLWILKKKKIF